MLLETAKSILLIVSALFPIVNPIGGSPVFLLLTQDYSKESRKLLARRVAINSFILLIVSMVLLMLILTALCVLGTMAALAMERRKDVGLM